jgi:hypothetical protein
MYRIAFLAFAIAACTKPAGGPLKFTFDNSKIAAVPLETKQTVTEAQQQYDLARLAHTRTVDQFHDAQVEQELAEYQAEHNVIISQIAAARLGLGSASGDTSALARTAADAKVAFARARREWLAALVSSSLYAEYAAGARLELARAKVAQDNHLTAAGFDLATYQRQSDDRTKAAQDATATTERERAAVEAKLSSWADAEHAFMKASNITGPAESDRVAIEWKQALAAPAPTLPPPAEPAPPPVTPAAPAAAAGSAS